MARAIYLLIASWIEIVYLNKLVAQKSLSHHINLHIWKSKCILARKIYYQDNHGDKSQKAPN